MEILQPIIVFFIGLFLVILFSKFIKVNQKISLIIYLWHSVFCLIFIDYAISNNLDSIGYFEASLNLENIKLISNDFVRSFNSIFSRYLGLNLTSCFFVFNLIGSLGQILFYKNIKPFLSKIKSNFKYLVWLTIWLPTIHFWTASIGKDALVYFFINLSIFCLNNLRTRFLLLFLSLICISLIRPHIGITIFISISIALLLKINIPKKYSLIFRISTFLALLYFLNFSFLRIGETTLNVNNLYLINDIINYNRNITEVGGTAVDLSSMNIVERLFTYMFRPFFIDANGLFGLVSSVDNLILFLIFTFPFLKLVIASKVKKLDFAPKNIFFLMYTSLTWFFLSTSTSNLGLALRHKLMFLPCFIILILDLSTSSSNKLRSKKHY